MGSPFVGEIRMFAGKFAPPGWLECDGRRLPIEPPQILASIYHGMGINLDTTMMSGPGERPIRLVDAEPIQQLFA